MDAKDLRTESNVDVRSHDGSNKYPQSAAAITCNRNKPYHDIGSNSLGKVDVPSSRPCAVIGPDRVVPPPAAADSFSKKPTPDQWLCNDTMYRRPPDYPIKMTDFQSTARNISPRQTFQENMQRIMVPPTYSSVKMSNESNLSADGNSVLMPKNSKINIPTETKYCDVPYNISPLPVEQKSFRDVNVPSVNSAINQSSPYGWSTASTVRPSRPYGAPDLYQYPDYPGYASARTIPVGRPQRNYHEETIGFPERFYPDTNMRFKPYPQVKEGYPQQRYECINNYPNSYHPPPYPPPRYDIQKSHNPHLYSSYSQVPVKYFDSRMSDSVIDGYQRSNVQPNYNVSYPNQFLHPAFAPVPGNCLQNKLLPYSQDMPVKNNPLNKLAYENKLYADYENMRNKPFAVPENYYNPKGQILVSKPHTSNLQSGHPYLKKEYPTFRNYDPNKYPDVTSNMANPMLRFPSQFSPITALPDHITSNESNQALGILLEDNYGHHSSVTNVRNTDPNLNRLHPDLYGRYDYNKFSPVRRPTLNRAEANVSSSKEKKNIDVRQFLQQWNEDDDNNDGNNGSQVTQNASEKKLNADQEELYVLGLVHVPSEELGKYDHIQKISKLPDNIKGYNSLELLNQFEEAIGSSKFNTSKNRELQGNFKAMPVQRATVPPIARPLSPLDVEAKISQSVIHKEVGCNFEIKPCSPKMLNVEIATPIQTVLNERVIEKLSNPLISESPQKSEKSESLGYENNDQDRNEIANLNSSSCNMDQTKFAAQNYTPSKNDFINDLESNSGLCLASLPRLDNEIELNFPEVNQQFIKANSKSDTVITTPTEIQGGSTRGGGDKPLDQTNDENCKDRDNPEQHTFEMEATQKLCKFRKLKKEDFEHSINVNAAQAVRTDSVIIKNPDTSKEHECNNSVTSPVLASADSQINATDKEFPIQDLLNVEEKDPNIALDFSVNKYEYSFGDNENDNLERSIFSSSPHLSSSNCKNNEFDSNEAIASVTLDETESETVSKTNVPTFRQESSDLGPDQKNITRNLSVDVKLPSDNDSDAGSFDDSKSILFGKSKKPLSPQKANEDVEFCDMQVPAQTLTTSSDGRDITEIRDDHLISESTEKVENNNDLENKIHTETSKQIVSANLLNVISDARDSQYQNSSNNHIETDENIILDHSQPSIAHSEQDENKNKNFVVTTSQNSSNNHIETDENIILDHSQPSIAHSEQDDNKNKKNVVTTSLETPLVKKVSEINDELKDTKVVDSLKQSEENDDYANDLSESIQKYGDQATYSNKKDLQDFESNNSSKTDNDGFSLNSAHTTEHYESSKIHVYSKDNCDFGNFEHGGEKESSENDRSASEDISQKYENLLHDKSNRVEWCRYDSNKSEPCSESNPCIIDGVKNIYKSETFNIFDSAPYAQQFRTKANKNQIKEESIQEEKSDHLSNYKINSTERPLDSQEKINGSNTSAPEKHCNANDQSKILPKLNLCPLSLTVNCPQDNVFVESKTNDDFSVHTEIIDTPRSANSTTDPRLKSSAVQNLSTEAHGFKCFEISKEMSCGKNISDSSVDQEEKEVISHEQNLHPRVKAYQGDTIEKSSTAIGEIDSLYKNKDFQGNCSSNNERHIKHIKRIDNISLITGICFTALSLDMGISSKEQISNIDKDGKIKLVQEGQIIPILKHDVNEDKKSYKNELKDEDKEDDTLKIKNNVKSDLDNPNKIDYICSTLLENQSFTVESKIDNSLNENQFSIVHLEDADDTENIKKFKIYTHTNNRSHNTIIPGTRTESNFYDINGKQFNKINNDNSSSSSPLDWCSNQNNSSKKMCKESKQFFMNKNDKIFFNVRQFSPFICKLLMFEEGKLPKKSIILPKNEITSDFETSSMISVHKDSSTLFNVSPQVEVYGNAPVVTKTVNYEVTRLKDLVSIFLRDHFPNIDLNVLPYNFHTTQPSQIEYEDQVEKKVSKLNCGNKHCIQKSLRLLKRSLSESDLGKFEESAVEIKRNKIDDNSDLQQEVIAGNIFLHNRRNTVSTFINDDNVYILLDDNCIITEESDDFERASITEETESLELFEKEIDDEGDCNINIRPPTSELNYLGIENPHSFNENTDEAGPWIEDVACVETVVSDNVAEDIEITSDFSPRNDSLSDYDSNSEDVLPLNSDYDNTDKVKHIYEGCHDDESLVETLYRTPQMNVNKTLVKENPDIIDINPVDREREDLENMLSESMNTVKTMYSDVTSIARDSLMAARSLASKENTLDKQMLINLGNRFSCQNDQENELEDSVQGRTIQFGSAPSCESSSDSVFTYTESKNENSKFSSSSSSPEVSSTTSEEKCSSILLKITSYNGSIVSEISNSRDVKRMCCKYTEKSEYNTANNSANRPLITKAAQKYIPPICESINDLKVKLPLPQNSLDKLQQLKKNKDQKLEKNISSRSLPLRPDVLKKPKPKFEDVLKSIDDIQFQMHKNKSKKVKKNIPKVVIKKNENGYHYTSSTAKKSLDPDLTGRKWQPWVFIERNVFIDKMAMRKRTEAIYSHRKKEYVFKERFHKYKSVSSTKFVITQPNLDDKGHLKYTIKLKHNY